jgi:hypothetical protein
MYSFLKQNKYINNLLFGVFFLTIGVLGSLVYSQFVSPQNTASAAGNIYTVTSNADSGSGTLRDAITQANANPGQDIVTFNITGPITMVNQVNVTDSLVLNGIDGTTNPSCIANIPPTVEIISNGGNIVFNFTASDNIIKGLNIHKPLAPAQISAIYNTETVLQFNNSSNNTVSCNYFGVGPDGTIAPSFINNRRFGYGIAMNGTSTNNTIGGTTVADKNVIGGIQGHGIFLDDNAGNNKISGNFIGIDASGTKYAAVASSYGFNFSSTFYIRPCRGGSNATWRDDLAGAICVRSDNNTIGGDTVTERNIIHGIDRDLIISVNAENNIVRGNYFGTDITGY